MLSPDISKNKGPDRLATISITILHLSGAEIWKEKLETQDTLH